MWLVTNYIFIIAFRAVTKLQKNMKFFLENSILLLNRNRCNFLGKSRL